MKLQSKRLKGLALFLTINIMIQAINPTVAWALSGGPSQPEVQSFAPVGTSEMVDLFSGNFNYNIPLLDIDGYPMNINYNSGVTMDQEASWVGLGWNINPGAITRNMRGLPDDFKGDIVKKEFNVNPNTTYGLIVGLGGEVAGWNGVTLGVGLGINFNTYNGYGVEEIINVSLNLAKGGKGPLSAGLGLKSSNSEGLSVSPSLSFSAKIQEKDQSNISAGLSIGTSINSRHGMKSLSINASLTEKKDKKESGSIGAGGSISFGVQTYVPQINMPMRSLAATFKVKFGVTFASFDGTGDVTGYFSDTRLERNKEDVPAYGYYNMHEGQQDNSILDFNREKDGEFTIKTPALPVTSFTYDVLSVNGQGVSGTYRPFRSDIGYVFDRRVMTTSDSYSLALELKSANVAEGGGEINVTDVNSYSGKWTNNNSAGDKLAFKGKTDDLLYEPFCLKEAGEKNVDSDPAMYEQIYRDQAIKIPLIETGGLEVGTVAAFSTDTEQKTIDHSYRKGLLGLDGKMSNPRQKRNQAITFLTKDEAKNFALDKNLNVSTLGKGHHLQELTALRPDGKRYIYGLPVYNNIQKEVSFNASGSTANCATGLVPYSPQIDNSVGNLNGNDRYFTSTILPPYAHSYMLTAVVSSDYVDLDDNGPSNGDLGTYTKFNYARVQNYKWRVPIEKNQANYDAGLKTMEKDNKGNYIYGEKDLYYLESIETKNYIAKFEIKDRLDASEVLGEDGGMGNQHMKMLNKISLYSKADYNNTDIGHVAIPIKEVHFEYDYSLCPNLPNNSLGNLDKAGNSVPENDPKNINANHGKLTLKKLYFTYGKSNKAQLSPYTFYYREDVVDSKQNRMYNADYNLKGYDRWGNYKPNNPPYLQNNCDESRPYLPPYEFPYVEQDKATADVYSSMWSLSKVGLPSGGTINVKYESDEYAFVQDRPAMQMFKITGVGYSPVDNPTKQNQLASLDPTLNHLFFKLPVDVANETDMYNKYLKGITSLYFRALIRVNNMGNEFVSGYGGNFKFGLSTYPNTDGSKYGYIAFNHVDDFDPISKAAVKFARLYTPQIAFNVANEPSADLSPYELLSAMANAGLVKNIIEGLQDPDKLLYRKGFGQFLVPNKSWLRLLNPNKRKLGGGHRVASINISDEWGTMVGAAGTPDDPTASYGQEYSYDIEDPENDGQMMSSGVASYEPMVGADENPFRMPVNSLASENSIAGFLGDLLAPDSRFYQEEPYGESFFPSPSVGYSRVRVKNINPSNVIKHATGYVVHEFFTARDYPTLTSRTNLVPSQDIKEMKSNLLDQILSLDVRHYMTATQGFSVVLNDMHGKQKSQKVFAEGKKDAISGVEYFYKDNGKVADDGSRRRGKVLDNTSVVIDKKGVVSTAQVGVDYDVVADMREQYTNTGTNGLQVNIYGFFVFVVPIVIPPIWPSSAQEETRFRSSVVTKVVNHYALLDETVAFDLGSVVSTKNLALDAETGEVLLTKTKNEYADEVFSFTYPAHWAQDRMGSAYQNIGVSVPIGSNNSVSNPSRYFVPGDEISFDASLGWITAVSDGGNYITAIDKIGTTLVLDNKTVKVIRSGRRNMQSVSVGSLTSMKNPIDVQGNGNTNSNAFMTLNQTARIINASSIEYSEDVWKTFCDCRIISSKLTKGGEYPNAPGAVFNPYIIGLKGNWRPKKSYLFLTDRIQEYYNKNTNLRKDGSYLTFNPFWKPDGGNNWTPSLLDARWTWTSEITSFSPYSVELENRDALNRYSAATYGYSNSLPTAVAANSKYQQIAFDNFEDYNFDKTCLDDHFSFKPFSLKLENNYSHTGNYSIKVGPGQDVKITKALKVCE
jgi:hypothetical protein